MSERSRLRLYVIQVLVLSLLVTLGGRLWYLQVVTADEYQRAATDNRVREVVTPAIRGLILDDKGRPLVRNRTTLVVSVSRTELLRQRDRGRAMIARVAKVLGRDFDDVWGRTRLCGTAGAPPPPVCWSGSPYQAIPVVEDADTRLALQILEHQEDYPGVTAELGAVRDYPGGGVRANAAHLLGYVGPVSDYDLEGPRGKELQKTDTIGRAGLERQYDADLRGKPGVTRLAVDNLGGVTGTVSEVEPTPGNHLVTSIDAKVQAVAEQQLRAAITRARTVGDRNKGGKRYKADSGAVVVMDVTTGRIVAMASWPTYDPMVWVGGITAKEYARISGARNNFPNQSRATQGEFAPGSTFKVISLAAAVMAGYPLGGTYPCPGSYDVGGRNVRNYESQAYGQITLKRAIEVSCDTVFYKFAYEMWLRDGGITPRKKPRDGFTRMAKAFGLGRKTGLDLPEESDGRIADRAWKQQFWQRTKELNCAKARTGYPELTGKDPARAMFLKRLARENCLEGNRYRAGDAVNFSIGQGDTTTTPLQMARVYAAVANGGTLWVPTVGKAVLGPDGKVVRQIKPRSAGRVPVRPEILRYLQKALRGVPENGTARYPFIEWPLDKLPMAAKTGTSEVYGKQSTSWFAAYGPTTKPQYSVVMMVSQGGTGSGVSGPSVAKIFEALLGVKEGKVVPSAAILRTPPTALPRIRPDGTIVVPRDSAPATPVAPRDAAAQSATAARDGAARRRR